MPEFVVPAREPDRYRQEREPPAARRGLIPGVRLRRSGKDAVAVAGLAAARSARSCKSASGENTLFDLELGGDAPQGDPEGVPARPAARASCCTPTSTRSRSTSVLEVTVHVELAGRRPMGVKLQGGIARLRHPRARGRVPAGRHPREDRGRRHRPRARQAPARLATSRSSDKVKVADASRHRGRPRGAAARRGGRRAGRRRRRPRPRPARPSPRSSRRARPTRPRARPPRPRPTSPRRPEKGEKREKK